MTIFQKFYRIIILFALVIIFSSCTTRNVDRKSIIRSYDNTHENQNHLRRKEFKNRIDSEIPSKGSMTRIPIL